MDGATQTLKLERNGWVPNSPHLPVLIYPGAVDPQTGDLAARFEEIFSANGWPPQWRYTIYDFHHYHTEGHEVLGIASGRSRVMLGGPDGVVLEVSAGDALLLPAGTGHCSLESSEDFLVVGAYPPGQGNDICMQAPSHAQQARIEVLPFPDEDPVQGLDGAVRRYWVGNRPT
ncbi:cupin [Pseudomonas syringae]|nr:cupin [Pseudomonas syringae]MCF5069280.1 cupin [Pseudomonas syringae]